MFMKNGETKVNDLTAMIDDKIGTLEREIQKWRQRREETSSIPKRNLASLKKKQLRRKTATKKR